MADTVAVKWEVARLVGYRDETAQARTLAFAVPGWPGHLAGQHVDVRLTAEDGYSTQRSYSLAAPADGDRIELTVQRVPDGEVSPYLTEVLGPGDPVEIRGPVGGWFVWRPGDGAPVLLVGGGSGIVPLMAMIRARRATGSRVPFRLVYSVRTPADRYYTAEFANPAPGDAGLEITYIYSRVTPPGWPRPAGRLRQSDLSAASWPASSSPACLVCGPTEFVELAAGYLTSLGHDPRLIKTERFGPGGDWRDPAPAGAGHDDRAERDRAEPDMTEQQLDVSYLDGNALAGPLSEVFAVDLTVAAGRCANCGLTGPVAGLRLHARAPGLVARCPGCDAVMLRLVRGPATVWLDLRGTACLEIPIPGPSDEAAGVP